MIGKCVSTRRCCLFSLPQYHNPKRSCCQEWMQMSGYTRIPNKRLQKKGVSVLFDEYSPCLREWDTRVRNETRGTRDGGHSEMNLFMGCERGGGGTGAFFGMFVVWLSDLTVGYDHVNRDHAVLLVTLDNRLTYFKWIRNRGVILLYTFDSFTSAVPRTYVLLKLSHDSVSGAAYLEASTTFSSRRSILNCLTGRKGYCSQYYIGI